MSRSVTGVNGWLRVLAALLLLCVAGSVLKGSSCYYYHDDDDDDCHDDDDDDDDDDCHHHHPLLPDSDSPDSPAGDSTLFAASSPLLLRIYERVPEDGPSNPTLYTSIEGICLFSVSGESVLGKDEIIAFCREVLRVNRQLLLPRDTDAHLEPLEVEFSDRGVRARFALSYREDTGLLIGVDGAGIEFRLDGLGNLCEIASQLPGAR